jgi:hypothetical protein
MNRLQKVSSYLLILFNILLVLTPVSLLFLWSFIDHEPLKGAIEGGLVFEQVPISTPQGLVNLATVNWNDFTKSIGFLSSLVNELPILLGLLILKNVFRNYQRGDIFNLYNAKQYKNLGYLFFLAAFVTQPLSGMLKVLAITFSNPVGQRTIQISFGTPTFETLFCGVLILVISWVMAEGCKLQEEQKFTI